jgi:hypothetical protein
MQHAAIDSNSTAPMLTGTSFSSISFFSSFRPFNQYKANAILRSALGPDFSVLKECFSVVANHRCRQIGVNALCPGSGNPLPWTAEIVNLRDKNFCKPVPSDRWRVAPGFAGLRETALAHA